MFCGPSHNFQNKVFYLNQLYFVWAICGKFCFIQFGRLYFIFWWLYKQFFWRENIVTLMILWIGSTEFWLFFREEDPAFKLLDSCHRSVDTSLIFNSSRIPLRSALINLILSFFSDYIATDQEVHKRQLEAINKSIEVLHVNRSVFFSVLLLLIRRILGRF